MNENDSPRPVHELEPPPTAPHPPDADPTILARWLYRAYEQGPVFWLFLGGLAVLLAGLGVVISSLSAAKSVTSQAWIDLIPARTPEDQLKVADANPKTPVADWARLQAAYNEYGAGLGDLTSAGQRESAGPRLKRALDLFSQVAREAPSDSPQARGAAFAVARVLETRNELPEAIKQYRLVAETWKDSPEAKQAIMMARLLEDPNSVQFYRDLYASKPATGPTNSSLIPALSSPFSLPGSKPVDLLVPGTSSGGKSFLPELPGPAGIDPPPAPTPATTPTTAPGPPPAADKPAEAPKAEAPKAETPKAADVPPAATPPK